MSYQNRGMPRLQTVFTPYRTKGRHGASFGSLRSLGCVLAFLAACDKSGPLADLDTGSPAPAAASIASTTSPPSSQASAPARDAGRVMPPRPVPTSTPTVTIGMPEQVQLQAISYMQAMQARQPGDAPDDPAYDKQVGDSLRSLGKVDVTGRKIEIMLAKGCDASFPKSAAGRSSAGSLGVLLANGVLVIGCADRVVRCLQSTRDPDDVLCVHK